MADKHSSDMSGSAGGEEIHPENAIKSKRKLACRQITLSIKRIHEKCFKGQASRRQMMFGEGGETASGQFRNRAKSTWAAI